MYHVVGILAQCYPLYAMFVEPAGEVIAQLDVMVLGPAGVPWSVCSRADSVAPVLLHWGWSSGGAKTSHNQGQMVDA